MFSEILTVKAFLQIYKGDEAASNIHVVTFEENDYRVVAQKSLYKEGDKALYIFPDTNLKNIPLFDSYFAPEGNPNKCRLGKNGRVKSVKFGWTYDNGSKVYSQGILLPFSELPTLTKETWDEELELYKEVEEIKVGQVDAKGVLPRFVVKSDEEHFQKNGKCIKFPADLIVTKKYDGSSCTVYRFDSENKGICQRTLEKKLDVVERKYESYRLLHNKEKGIQEYFNTTTKTFVTDEEFEKLNVPFTDIPLSDNYTKMGLPILQMLEECNISASIRMEIYGAGINSHGANNDAKQPLSYAVYGVDRFDEAGNPTRVPQKKALEFAKSLGLNTSEILLEGVFESYDALKEACDKLFEKQEKPIEGVVIRSAEDNSYSGKYLCDDYDERKK